MITVFKYLALFLNSFLFNFSELYFACGVLGLGIFGRLAQFTLGPNSLAQARAVLIWGFDAFDFGAWRFGAWGLAACRYRGLDFVWARSIGLRAWGGVELSGWGSEHWAQGLGGRRVERLPQERLGLTAPNL